MLQGTKEFQEAIEMFDRIAKKEFYGSLDKDKSNIKGVWYQNGNINNLFKAFLHGIEFQKSIERLK